MLIPGDTLTGAGNGSNYHYVLEDDLVPTHRIPTPAPGRVAAAIGLGRLGIGIAFLADPVSSVRVLGVDSATAKRMTFLARMTAGRDIVLGLGTVASRTPRGKAGWLAAGAAADAIDAAVLGAGLRSGQLHGVPATGIAVGAAGAAALAFMAAGQLRRG